MFRDDDPMRVSLAGSREPGWVGTLGELGRGLKAVATGALRGGWDTLRGPPAPVVGRMPARCTRCGNSTYWWTRRDDPGDGWHCGICEPQPAPPPRRPARDRGGVQTNGG